MDTGSQFNVIMLAVLSSTKLLATFPGIDIVRPGDFSVELANRTTAPVLGTTKRHWCHDHSWNWWTSSRGWYLVRTFCCVSHCLCHATMIKCLGLDMANKNIKFELRRTCCCFRSSIQRSGTSHNRKDGFVVGC